MNYLKNKLFQYLLLIILLPANNISCSSKENNSPTPPNVNTKPVVTSFTPASGTTNTTVTITGSNFTGTTSVSFGGTEATSFSVFNSTTIEAVIGLGTNGDVKVTTPSGSATKSGFTYFSSFEACKLPEFAVRTDVGIGFPRFSYRTPTTGTVKVTVIFVDFSDAPATRTPQEAFTAVSPAAENYFSAVSYGKMNLTFVPKYQWFRMSKASSNYGWSSLTFNLHKAYIDEAIALADPTVDFSTSDAFLIISNPDAGSLTNGPAFCATPGVGVTVDGKVINNGATSGRDLVPMMGMWFPHEFGHTMSLVDLYAFSGQPAHRFVGYFSLMGNSFPEATAHEYTGWERWILGWLNDNQVACGNTTGVNSITLTPIEKKDGVKILVIPVNGNSALVVESRKALGYDSRLSKEGPLVYVVDTKIASGQGTVKVLPIDNTDNNKISALMSPGQTITLNNITVKFVSTGTSGDLIEYTIK